MRRGRCGAWPALTGLALLLAACATSPNRPQMKPPPRASTPQPARPAARRPAPAVAPRPVRPVSPATVPISSLDGWKAEDHLAAFRSYRAGCRAARDAGARTVCARAQGFDPADDAAARAFLETNFKAALLAGEGLLTAYYTPEYQARRAPDAEFSAPLRPRPADLAPLQAPASAPAAGAPNSYPDRAAIEARPAPDALAWMRPEDLFFMQIQGSGVLDFPDGSRLKAVTTATNGLPFVGIAAPMRQRGLLPDNRTSGEAIHDWLAAHRGPEADEIMRLDPRYGFFALVPFTGGVSGAAGVPLTGGRAVAVDARAHAMGGLYWIVADAPALTGAPPGYRRAVMALDVGGAIKGAVRADLYAGLGAAAGQEAGRVRHRLRLYELVPVP